MALGILPDADLKAKYDFLSECKAPAIFDEFRNIKYVKISRKVWKRCSKFNQLKDEYIS